MQPNHPTLWHHAFPWPTPEDHKYTRGSVLVAGGGMASTGAARLAAHAALRLCGLATIACPASALPVYAASLLAVMVRPYKDETTFAAITQDKKYNTLLLGPGMGVGEPTHRKVLAALATRKPTVLDADALTSFAGQAATLRHAIRENAHSHTHVILTPHKGELTRLFGPMEYPETALSDLAVETNAVLLLKGHNTLIAAPDGRLVVNEKASPWLATAGSGDVLAGLCAGLLANGLDAFTAACIATWLHAEAARLFGAGMTAEDLSATLPHAITALEPAHE